MFSPLLLIAASLADDPSLVANASPVAYRASFGGGAPRVLELVSLAPAMRRPCRIAVTIGTGSVDDPLAQLLRAEGVLVHRGDPDDVLDRSLRAAELFGGDALILVAACPPFPAPSMLDDLLAAWSPDLDCLVNRRGRGDPLFMVSFDALVAAWQEATLPGERAKIGRFFERQAGRFRTAEVRTPRPTARAAAPIAVR